MVALDFKKAILVDNDGDIAVQCERVLRRCGATEVLLVKSLKSAGRRLASKEEVGFLLIDVDLAEVAGDSIANLLFGVTGGSHANIPVVFIAKASSRADVKSLQEAGCYSFVMKPLNDTILESKIRQAAEKSFDSDKELEIILDVGMAFEQRRLDDAEKILRPLLRRYPTNQKFQTLLAELFFLRGDGKTAAVIVEKTLKTDPSFNAAIELQGKLRSHEKLLAKRAGEAAENAKMAAAQAELDVLRGRANSFARGGQYEQSVLLFESLLQRMSGHRDRHLIALDTFNAYLDWRNLEKAAHYLKECENMAPAGWDGLQAARDKLKEVEAVFSAELAAKEAEAIAPGNADVIGFAPPAGSKSEDLDPEEEKRILKFIMFEGKY